jgi:hypothetical protein
MEPFTLLNERVRTYRGLVGAFPVEPDKTPMASHGYGAGHTGLLVVGQQAFMCVPLKPNLPSSETQLQRREFLSTNSCSLGSFPRFITTLVKDKSRRLLRFLLQWNGSVRYSFHAWGRAVL